MAGRVLRVCRRSELSAGACRSVEGMGIVVFNVDGTFYATQESCTHARWSLADATIDGHVVECPLHGARYDVRDGGILRGPALLALRVYPVVVDGEDVYVEVDGPDGPQAGTEEFH